MDPRGTVGRIYKYRLLHTKYESFGPCGFGEEDFFMFFLMTPWGGGGTPYGHQGHIREEDFLKFFP